MPAVARLGDKSDHGGVIISPCSPTISADGIPVARKSDLHSCPIQGHGITAIITGSDDTFFDGKNAARIGDKAGCGATIIQGSPTFFDD